MKSLLRNILLASSAIALLAIAGCANSGSDKTEALEQGKAATNTVEASEESGAAEATTNEAESKAEEKAEVAQAKIIRKQGKVKNRGGFIKLSVNNNPITNFDISSREKFLRLRRQSGNIGEIAETEMIEQILKLQESVRRRTIATDEMVDTAFANFATRNRTTPANLSRELGKLGIGAKHFKDFIRTQISWQRTVQGRFQSETTQVTEQDAIIGLRSSGSEKPELTEYSFKQVIFVVPNNKRNRTTLAARKLEANAFRQNFTNCANTITLAKALKDVSVIDRKRILEPELPAQWKDDIANAGINGITPAKETEKGIELMAVCNKRQVQDDKAAKIANQSNEFSEFNQNSSEISKNYLNELRSRATIIYQ